MKKFNKEGIRRKLTSVHAWELPKQTGALAPDYVWVSISEPIGQKYLARSV